MPIDKFRLPCLLTRKDAPLQIYMFPCLQDNYCYLMGCGRLFEGAPGQMWASLQKIMRWPDETRIYCAHEYTQTNARFALTVEPENQALIDRATEVDRLREGGLPTIPTTIKLEKDTNPFLRPGSANIQATLALKNASLVDVFAETRKRKDNF